MANKTTEKVTLQQRVDSVKSGISDLHEEVLTTAHKMVDISLDSGAKWQKLMSKVVDKGTDLFEKQQDMTFNALEEVKSQYVTGSKRFKQLLGFDQMAKKAAKVQKETRSRGRKAANKATKLAEQTIDDVLAQTQDSLKSLKGIGPKMESLLSEAGIYSIDELANDPVKSLKAALQSAGARYQSMDPNTWKKLAQEAIANRNN